MKKIGLLFFTFLLCSCQFPKDPNDSLNKIRDHELKVGACPEINKIEKNLVTDIAQRLNAKVIFTHDEQENLYRKLSRNEVNLVICNIHENSPWKETLAFSTPYKKSGSISFVLALPAGENAWLHYVNEYLFKHQKDL